MKRSAIALAMLLMACAKTPAVPQETPPPAAPAPAAQGPRVIFPDGFAVKVEIAADDELRARGLMFRTALPPATGMLFFFAGDEEHAFWMKNTKIPLDMIWIDGNRRVVHVKHDVPPCEVENCPSYPPGVPSRYVLEVAAGVAREHGIKEGDVLKFEGTKNVVVR
jgi:uncharacterized membrane protein (UPF0127 family)